MLCPREASDPSPGEPAAAEPTLPGHSLQLLQDGREQAPDPRPENGPRDRGLPLPSVPDGRHTAYPLVRGLPEDPVLALGWPPPVWLVITVTRCLCLIEAPVELTVRMRAGLSGLEVAVYRVRSWGAGCPFLLGPWGGRGGRSTGRSAASSCGCPVVARPVSCGVGGWLCRGLLASLPSASLPFSEMTVVCPLLVLRWLCLHHECGLRSPLPWIHMHPEFCPLHLPEEILPGLSGPSALAICCLCFLVSLFLSLWGSCHLWCVGPCSWPHVFQWLAENGHLRTSEDGLPSARTLRESLAEFQVADWFPRIWKAVPPAFPSSSSVP